MIRKLNRRFQDYMREKRLKIGKYIWDRKEKAEIIRGNSFIEDNDIKSIIFMRYDGKIGDMVVNTLMFREIKKFYPNIKIAVVTKGAARDIIKNNPYVDKIYNYEKNSKKIKKLASEIALEKYDLLIDFSEMLRVNQMMLINLSKVRFNIGLDKKDWKLFDISLNSNEDFQWNEHITQRYLSYLKKLGLKIKEIDLSYDVFLEKSNKYQEFFKTIENKRILILNPYGASKHKSLNLNSLIKIIKYLEKFQICVVLIYFGDKYRELKILEKDNRHLYVPKNINSIQDSAYLISKAEYVVSPDTSIVHIASALKKKIVSIYPPNGGKYGVDHLVWAPLGENVQMLFCEDKKSSYDEIDINTFSWSEMKKAIDNAINQ